MSNIYLKVAIEEKRHTKSFKVCLPVSFWGAPTHVVSLNFQTCCNLKIRGLGAKLCVTFLLFLFWKEWWRFKVKESVLSFEQKYKV